MDKKWNAKAKWPRKIVRTFFSLLFCLRKWVRENVTCVKIENFCLILAFLTEKYD